MPTVAGIVLPTGAFPITSTNALSQSESKEYDPRFGQATKLTGPNGLATTWKLGDFGRKTKEKIPASTPASRPKWPAA
ncbi:MAG: hypothetical protein ABI574_13455 [Burkholderiales bacterium]